MSLKTRLSLLAGSSLVAASLSTLASLGMAALPSVAAAQSVCTPTPQQGAGTNNVTYTGSQFSGITCTAADALTVTNNATTNNAVDFSGATGGVTFIQAGGSAISGQWTARGSSVFSNAADTLTMNGLGNNTLAAGASIDFGNGDDTFNISGIEDTTGGTPRSGRLEAEAGAIDFGAGADLLNVTGNLVVNGTALDFGSGDDVFDLSGRMIWNSGAIVDLEAFDLQGVIYVGGQTTPRGNVLLYSNDGIPDDTFVMSSGVFTGSDGGRIVMDVDLGDHASQTGCASPTVADCADFTGAATAGSTMLMIEDVSFSLDGGTLGTVVTLVQGSSAAENFVLDPASDYYGETPQGPAIRKPVVAYRLVYDAVGQRHVLAGAPTDEVYQAATFAAAAQEAWRSTAGTWLDRQADLRATPGGLEASRGFWARVGAQNGERDVAASYDAAGLTFDYDLSHKQRIAHLTFGADILGAAGADSAWVLGAMVGFVRSDIEFDATPTEATATGYTGGLYASYVAGPLFVDATANLNILHVKADTPALGLGLDVPMTFDMKSLGGQVEAGWRIEMGSGLFIEPLAGVSYVVTDLEDTEVPGGAGVFEFENTRSLRLGGGARVGVDGELLGMSASYSLTGRYWNDSEGGSSADIVTVNGSSATLADDFGGGFGEVGASLGLYSRGGGVSGFVNLGGRFADDYQSLDGAVGVRVRW